MEGAQRASKVLSSQPLTLITAHASLLPDLARLFSQDDASQMHSGALGSAPDVLSAFSVPSHLWGATELDAGDVGGAATSDGGAGKPDSAQPDAAAVIRSAVAGWAAWLEQQLKGSGLVWQGWMAQDVGIRSVAL